VGVLCDGESPDIKEEEEEDKEGDSPKTSSTKSNPIVPTEFD